MDIYQRILGLQFTKLDNPEVWHEDVEMYQVYTLLPYPKHAIIFEADRNVEKYTEINIIYWELKFE